MDCAGLDPRMTIQIENCSVTSVAIRPPTVPGRRIVFADDAIEIVFPEGGLDLRGGWGGAAPDYVSLFAGAIPVMTFIDRTGAERLASFQWRRPVVIAIDEATRSGKEVF